MHSLPRVCVGPYSVSTLCLGIVGHPKLVRDAYERGVNFFALTTDMHWPVYESTRLGLADLFLRFAVVS